MPKIAITMPRFGLYGGAEGFGWRLAEALGKAGHGVDFLCARAEGESPAGVTPVELGRPPLGRAVKNICFDRAVERRLRAADYDVVIGLGRTRRQDILRVGGGPMAVFNRLTLPAYGEGAARLFKRLRRALSPANAVIARLEAAQFDTPANPNQRIVCVSDLVRDWLLEAHPAIDPARVRVIYNSPDLARFCPPDAQTRAALRAQRGIAADDIVICTAGTNFALKGLGTLIRALPLLPPRFRLAVAGGRHSGPWRDMARGLGVATRVDFLGRVDDMPAFYAAADVFALPSHYDACSNAVLEALACGLPAVTTARNGSAAFLPPELVLPDPADAKDLAARIRLALDRASDAGTTPFVWPSGRACGLAPYFELIDEILAEKGRAT